MSRLLEELRNEEKEVDWSKSLGILKIYNVLITKGCVAYIDVDLTEKPLMKLVDLKPKKGTDLTTGANAPLKKQKYFFLRNIKFLKLVNHSNPRLEIGDNLRWQFGVMIYNDLLPIFSKFTQGRAIIEVFKLTERRQLVKLMTADEYTAIGRLADAEIRAKFPAVKVSTPPEPVQQQ